MPVEYGRYPSAGTLTAVRQYDRQQMVEGIPALKQCLSQAAQSMAESTTVQKTMQEWWVTTGFLSLSLSLECVETLHWVDKYRLTKGRLLQRNRTIIT